MYIRYTSIRSGLFYPLYTSGRSYIFDNARANGKSRYVEIDAGHLDTPDKAKGDFILWLKSLGS